MTARRDPDRLIDAFLHEGADQLHDQVYDAVRSSIEQRRQRVVIGPWRMPTLNKLVPIAIGVAAVVVVLVLGSRLLPAAPAGVAGGAPTAAPSVAPTPAPSAAQLTPPALTGAFTSARNGVSLAYPVDWTARPATEPWTSGVPDFMSHAADVLYDAGHAGGLWIAVASQPLAGKPGATWASDVVEEVIGNRDCSEPVQTVTVDGAQGRQCGGSFVAVPSGDRGYIIWLYTSSDVPAVDAYSPAWFQQVLSTVTLQPDKAVDASAAP